MNQKVGIDVAANLDVSAIEQKLNALGASIAQANKATVSPVSAKSLADMDALIKKFAELQRVSSSLRKRLNDTGQKGVAFENIDWNKLYPNASSRAGQMRNAFQYVTGAQFTAAAPSAPQPPPGKPPGPPPMPPHPYPPRGPGGGGSGGGGGPGMGASIVGAGLRAAGPAGGVAAGALNTGMSAGFGAGLAGLLGGLAALGVSKIVGGVIENVGKAEDNAVALDRLKRTIGDVNVSFGALKASVHAGADNVKITYEEAGRLAQQFAKLGNVTPDSSRDIGEEMANGVGLARGYGLDPSQGVGLMGSMRGLGVTRDLNESRKFGLLIGETIGKSGAFAKADTVMEAIADYATLQTRNSMGGANISGFAGMYSGMVGSGIAGLDPTGAGALLNRINASLSQGGAKGEASQFFTGRMGARLGLNSYDTQLWREGGAMSTLDSTFQGGGAVAEYYRKNGIAMPRGDKTMLAHTMQGLSSEYGNDPRALLAATSGHLGINMSQAAALLQVKPNEMGGLEAYAGDLTKLSGSGISNLSKAVYGSSDDRRGLADSLLRRNGASALSETERQRLDGAMAGGDAETQKRVLAELVSSRDQERTQGSDIRDSKAALDNIKTNLADKLIPLTLEMRHGIMSIAGSGGKKTSEQIMAEVIGADSKGRVGAINGRFDPRISELEEKRGLLKAKSGIPEDALYRTYHDKPDVLEAKLKERASATTDLVEVEKEIAKLEKEKAGQITEENKRRDEQIAQMKADIEKRRVMDDAVAQQERGSQFNGAGGQVAPPVKFGGSGLSRIPNDGPALVTAGSIDEKLAAAERANGLPSGMLKSVMHQETGGKQAYLDDPAKYHYGLNAEGRRVAGHTGRVSTAFGPFGILESTGADPGYGVKPLKDKGIDEQIRFSSEYLAARSRSAGSIEGGLAGYGEGAAYSQSVMRRMQRNQGTPMPADAPGAGAGAGTGLRISIDPTTFQLHDSKGESAAPPALLQPRISSPGARFGGPQ